MTTPSPEFIYDVLSEFAPAIQAELERDYRLRPNDYIRDLIDEIDNLSIDTVSDLLNDLFAHPTTDSYSRYLSNQLADEIIGRFFDAGFIPTYLSGTNPADFQLEPVQFVLSPQGSPSGTHRGLTESGTLVTTEDVTPPESPRSSTPPLSPTYPVARPDIGTVPVREELIAPFPVYAQTWRQTPTSAYRELPVDTYNVRPIGDYDGRPSWPSYPRRHRYPDRHHEIQSAINRSGLRSSYRYYR
jgi:hypothetical protein